MLYVKEPLFLVTKKFEMWFLNCCYFVLIYFLFCSTAAVYEILWILHFENLVAWITRFSAVTQQLATLVVEIIKALLWNNWILCIQLICQGSAAFLICSYDQYFLVVVLLFRFCFLYFLTFYLWHFDNKLFCIVFLVMLIMSSLVCAA